MSSTDAHARLERLLLVVPFAVHRKGISLGELAALIGMGVDELRSELETLTLVGVPPFNPDDLIDLAVEEDAEGTERVTVALDQSFSKPPPLTASEGAALASAAEFFRFEGNLVLDSAINKLRRILPKGAHGAFASLRSRIDVHTAAPLAFAPLEKAAQQREEVALTYSNASRQVTEERTVHPVELLYAFGAWYLSAYCCTRMEGRLFRLDRISGVLPTGKHFESATGQAVLSLADIPGSRMATIRLSREAAPSIIAQFGNRAVAAPNGQVVIQIAADSVPWVIGWVLSYGGAAEVLAPQDIRDEVARSARRILGPESSCVDPIPEIPRVVRVSDDPAQQK